MVVGTDKGDVLAFDPDGKPAWTARVSTEVVAPPRVAEGIVVVFTGDGNIHALNAADGTRKWVNQRSTPRSSCATTRAASSRAAACSSVPPGGHLLALDLPTGVVGWDATVANPKGATELERIADVTSLPLVGEKDVCAVAYQGRVACFDLTRGTLIWSRDISSLYSMAGDSKNIYRHRRQGRGACARPRHRRVGVEAGPPGRRARSAVRNWSAISSASSTSRATCTCSSPVNGAYVGRMPTDGKPATRSRGSSLGGGVIWQSASGAVYAVSAK